MTSSLGFDASTLPSSPLTMSLLVGLESSSLRKLLKNGLRRGMNDDQIRSFFLDTWRLELESAEAVQLLGVLKTREEGTIPIGLKSLSTINISRNS